MTYDRDLKWYRWALVASALMTMGSAAADFRLHMWLAGVVCLIWVSNLFVALRLARLMQQQRDLQRDHVRLMGAMLADMDRPR